MTSKSRGLCGALGLGLVLALDWPARADADQPLAPSPAPRGCPLALAGARLPPPSLQPDAEKACSDLCSAGDQGSCVAVGLLLTSPDRAAPDPGQAAKLFDTACNQGSAAGCTRLGELLAGGAGVPRDEPLSVASLRKGCDGGDALGCADLGDLYAGGRGVAPDDARAAELYTRACDRGDAGSCFKLGDRFDAGRGVTRDDRRASDLYAIACDGGHAQACFKLGHRVEQGRGVARDEKRARDLLRRACDGDYSPGCADRDADAPPPPDGSGPFAPLDPFHAGVILSSGVGWLTDDAVHRYSLGRLGPTFHIGVTLELFDLITGAFSGGAIFPGGSSFHQTVVDVDGQTSVAESSTSVSVITVSGGLRTPLLRTGQFGAASGVARAGVFAYVRVGKAWIGGGSQISNCVDCSTTTLTLSDGGLVESGLDWGFKIGNGLGGSLFSDYRAYFGGASVAGEVRLGAGIWGF